MRIANVAALLGALALAGALLAGAAALSDGARTAHAQESGGDQQQAGADETDAEQRPGYAERLAARIARYQSARAASAGVSGQASRGIVSGLAQSILKGESDDFTVSSGDLDADFNYRYSFFLTSTGNGIGFNSTCTFQIETVSVPRGNSSYSKNLRLYGCKVGTYTLRAQLIEVSIGENEEYALVTETHSVRVTGNEPTITISRSQSSITEGQSARFTLTASPAPSSNLTVSVRVTQSGSFISGTAPTSVRISSGRTTASFTVGTSNDNVIERSGSITAQVRSGTGYNVGSPSSASVTVNDNDKPTITISRGTSPITEGTSARFTLTASAAPLSNLTVSVRVTQSGSFISGTAPTSVRISSGRTTASFTVGTSNDNVIERSGSITAQVRSGTGYNVGSPSSASVTVNDNDKPTITISRGTSPITEGTSARFTLTASAAPLSNLTVSVRVTQSGSFISGTAPTSVRIASGRTTASFTVGTSNDNVVESRGSITAQVRSGTGYNVGSPSSASVTVNDNDKLTVTISRGTSPITEGTNASFTLTANPAPLSNLSVRVSVSQSGAFISGSTPTSVRIPRGQTSASFTVRTSDDSVVERNGSITARVRSGTGYNVGSPFSASVTVNNNDHPTITIAAGTSPIAEGTTAQFTLTASAAPPSNLAVSVSVTQSGSFISGTAPTSVTIPANRTTATLSVPTLKDKVNEADGYVRASVRAGTNYAVGSTLPVSVSVRDTPYVSIAAGTSPITEGANATFTITAAGAPLSNMTVQVSVAESGTGSGTYIKGTAPSSVTIPANGTSVTLTVETEDDSTDEANGSIKASIVANSAYELGSASSASVAVQDNDLQKLAAPTGLTVTPLMPEDHRTPEWKARLDWGVVANRSRYQVEVRKTGGSWAAASSGSVMDASYKIDLRSIIGAGADSEGLAQASAYQFRVKAIASGSTRADSDYSAVVEIRDTPITSINGDSRSRTDGKGQAVVTWGAVPGATAFTLRWRKLPYYTGKRVLDGRERTVTNEPPSGRGWLPTEAKTENDWSTSAPIGQSSSSLTVSGLDLNEIYAFQLTYTHADGQGFAARESYVWPSTRGANKEFLASLPLKDPLPKPTSEDNVGSRAQAIYKYVICDDTFPQVRLTDWKNLIQHAAQQWQQATNGLVAVSMEDSMDGCAFYSEVVAKVQSKIETIPGYASDHIQSVLNEINLLDITEKDRVHNEIIKLSDTYLDTANAAAHIFPETAMYLSSYKCARNASACAPHPDELPNEWLTTDILISPGANPAREELAIPGGDIKFNACSKFWYAAIVHEVGHVLGIRAHATGALLSIMNYSVVSQTVTYDNVVRRTYACSPHPLDVMIAYALYQVGGSAS